MAWCQSKAPGQIWQRPWLAKCWSRDCVQPIYGVHGANCDQIVSSESNELRALTKLMWIQVMRLVHCDGRSTFHPLSEKIL